MNFLAYQRARTLKLLGLPRTQFRLRCAATELRLLKEAEAILGHYLWEECEAIPELNTCYTNIQLVNDEKQELLKHKAELEQSISALNSGADTKAQAALLREKVTKHHELASKRLASIEQRNASLKAQAKAVRKKFDQVAEQINSPSGELDISNLKAKKQQLKLAFQGLREELTQNEQAHAEHSTQLDSLAKQLEAQSSSQSPKTQISAFNRNINKINSQLATLDGKLEILFTEIGCHISTYFSANSQCQHIGKEKSKLIHIIATLKKSIQWNHAIAGR